ncbi:hypothetical protein T484DRAFT_2987616 [Baffinella frigidus]|nr:hypothetical protein T484DRAFT_2987616 [Cryptophyta sp. CCMP2293]
MRGLCPSMLRRFLLWAVLLPVAAHRILPHQAPRSPPAEATWGGCGSILPLLALRGGGRGGGDDRGGGGEDEASSDEGGESSKGAGAVGDHLLGVDRRFQGMGLRRHGTEAAGGKAKIVSEDELERRQRGSGKRRREEEEEGTVEVTEEVDDEARGRPVLRATPEHLRKLSKRKLVRLARDARLIVKASPLASTSQVRLALEPFLPTGKMLAKVEREAKAAKRQTRQKGKVAPKSKYGASKFEGGKEVSVYGVGGPTDTDFLQEAESTLKEDPDFASLSTKEREEELDGLARDLSDHYFRMVLIGEITPDGKSVASFTPGRPNLENALEEKELFASADPGFARQGEEEEGDGDVKEDEEKWAAAEERDYSIYTKEELNDLLHRASARSDPQPLAPNP